MPAINKQTLVNLLIDSPLREPIKINLIDIVNNTNDADLPKTFSTITKELEIFQKATERRMKLADETMAKLKEGDSASPTGSPDQAEASTSPSDLPPLPPMPSPQESAPAAAPAPFTPPTQDENGLAAPALDLPPLPKMDSSEAVAAAEPVVAATPAVDEASEPAATLPPLEPEVSANSDEDALKEIQKELDLLKSSASEEAAAPAGMPAPAPQA